jgi:phenol 2-monooxygenase
MARNQPAFTWERGFKECVALDAPPAWADERYYMDDKDGRRAHYVHPEQSLRPATVMETAMGVEQLPGWPAVFDGTMGMELNEHNEVMSGKTKRTTETASGSFKDLKQQEIEPLEEVDVLICGGE